MADWKSRATPIGLEPRPDADWKSRGVIVTDAPELDQPSELESGLRGAAQGGSFGFADELTGAGEALAKAAFGGDKFEDIPANYERYRDEARTNYHKAEQANPTAYGVGQLGGGLATSALTGGTSVGALATQGALQGLGASEAKNLPGLATDTAIGGAIGGAVGKVGEGLGKLGAAAKVPLEKTANFLDDAAASLSAHALGEGSAGLSKEQLKQAGRYALDQGIVSPLANVDDMIARNDVVKKGVTGIADQARNVESLLENKLAQGTKPLLDSNDMLTGMGGLALGHVGHIPAIVAKKAAERYGTQTGAVLSDNLANMVRVAPEKFGKFAKPLTDAAQRGGTSLAATHYILNSTNPEYRDLVNKSTNSE